MQCQEGQIMIGDVCYDDQCKGCHAHGECRPSPFLDGIADCSCTDNYSQESQCGQCEFGFVEKENKCVENQGLEIELICGVLFGSLALTAVVAIIIGVVYKVRKNKVTKPQEYEKLIQEDDEQI